MADLAVSSKEKNIEKNNKPASGCDFEDCPVVTAIDVIGGKLVEVNVMSPGGITYINKVYKPKVKIEEKVIDFLESKVLDKLQAFDRRSRLRKTVDEA